MPSVNVSRVPAIVKATTVLRFVSSSREPQSVLSIARATGLPRTSVLGICEALSDERMLVKGADGTYWLGPRVAELAAAVRLGSPAALRFGVLIPTAHNAYCSAMVAAAREEIARTGGQLYTRSADEAFDLQRAQWNELLDIGVDALLVDAVATDGYEECLGRAHRLGIPVVAIGSRINGVSASVTSDNTQAGLLAGRYLAARLPAGAQVGIVDGLEKNANADRVAGFREAVRDNPGITIVAHFRGPNDNSASGRAVAERLFAAHPDVAGVFAVCDPVAFGVAEYLSQTQSPVLVASVDGRAEAVRQIKLGGPIVATAAQDPIRMTRTGTRLAIELRNGNRAAQGAILTPVRLITAESAEDYTPWG